MGTATLPTPASMIAQWMERPHTVEGVCLAATPMVDGAVSHLSHSLSFSSISILCFLVG